MKEQVIKGLNIFDELTWNSNLRQLVPHFKDYDLWFSLRTAFAQGYARFNLANNKNLLYHPKKYLEYSTFKKVDAKAPDMPCDILWLDSAFDRYSGKRVFSPYVQPIIDHLNEYIHSQLSIMSLKSYSSRRTYDFFDYQSFFPLSSFILPSSLQEENSAQLNVEKIMQKITLPDQLVTDCNTIKSLGFTLKYVYPEAARYTMAYEKAFNFFKPKMLGIIAHCTPQVNTAVLVAKKRGIKVVEAIHGMTGDAFYPKDYVFPDKICTYGKKDYDNFIQGRVPANYLEITGNARSHTVQPKPFSKKENYVVLWLSQGDSYSFWRNKKLISLIFGWVKKKYNLSLVVRLHPDDKLRFLYSITAKGAGNITITKDTPLLSDIERADVVITKNSTAGIDAVSCGKPLLIEWMFESPDNFFNEYFPTFHDESSLDYALEEVISKKSWYAQRGKDLLDNLSFDHGNGAKNIAGVVRRLMDQKK